MAIKSVALIPARSGSKRVPDKNIYDLSGHPMIAYTISCAVESQVYDAVVCCTDSALYADIARHYGAEVIELRPPQLAGESSPDIDWVSWQLLELQKMDRKYDVFSILRPTSPFRTIDTIKKAWAMFVDDGTADSLRAVQPCAQHPGKMWVKSGDRIHPLMPFQLDGVPWHSNQYAKLPTIFAQDASLEIAWSRVAILEGSIAGESIIPFESQGYEGFDINEPIDLIVAESLLASGQAQLHNITKPAYFECRTKES
jgi:CMP-N,N'-diacetyllegionaminic acid synthase